MMADAMCRYHRLLGDRVCFLTGTDEHGEKIAQVGGQGGQLAAGATPTRSRRSSGRRAAARITYDDFIRTTEPRHEKVVQQILQELWDRGEI